MAVGAGKRSPGTMYCRKCLAHQPLDVFDLNPRTGRPRLSCRNHEEPLRIHTGAKARQAMIECCSCRAVLPADAYAIRHKATGRRATKCRACSNERQRQNSYRRGDKSPRGSARKCALCGEMVDVSGIIRTRGKYNVCVPCVARVKEAKDIAAERKAKDDAKRVVSRARRDARRGVSGKKVCLGCGKEKKVFEFASNGPGVRRSRCLRCRAKQQRAKTSGAATVSATEEDRERIRFYRRRQGAAKRTPNGLTRFDLKYVDWRDILAKWDNRCAYCKTSGRMTIDHAVPLSRGGETTKSNIVPACMSCNARKRTRTASEFITILLREGRAKKDTATQLLQGDLAL